MDLRAEYMFAAPVAEVWRLLMDTNAIAGCIPGCKGLTPLGNDRYEAELGVAIAAISGNFKGTVAMEEMQPPEAYRLVVEGTGRPGFVKGHARVKLTPDGDGTRVSIEAHADVGGTIARVGQRLLEGVARTMTDRFFTCLASAGTRPAPSDPGHRVP
jgi:uncharacterized protein